MVELIEHAVVAVDHQRVTVAGAVRSPFYLGLPIEGVGAGIALFGIAAVGAVEDMKRKTWTIFWALSRSSRVSACSAASSGSKSSENIYSPFDMEEFLPGGHEGGAMTSTLHRDATVIDGLNISRWGPETFLTLRQGGLTAHPSRLTRSL